VGTSVLFRNHELNPKVQLDDVAKAHPRIIETVETMLKKGKWTVPGYKEKFGDLNVM
jgi:hypothetical protein